MNSLFVIPARLESVRFPGKPLALIDNKPMIQWVYENTLLASDGNPVVVSTDSPKIHSFCESARIPTFLSNPANTGTDRVYQTANNFNADIVVNVQGDEPLLSPSTIASVYQETQRRYLLDPANKVITNSCCPCSIDELNDPNVVKVILTKYSSALFFTRLLHSGSAPQSFRPLKQQGVYGYSISALAHFHTLGVSSLENQEKIELMRYLDHEEHVSMVISNQPSYSVDTISDLSFVQSLIAASPSLYKFS